MFILVFETTGANASVACIDESGNIAVQESEGVLNHLQNLLPMTESLLKKNGIAARDISCVAASAGPGSFTGIRIGVSSARAFAQAMNIPCISVPTLQSFVYNIENYNGLSCPVLDARRGQVYGGAFHLYKINEYIHEEIPGGAYDIDEYLELLRLRITGIAVSDIMFFGDGIKVYQDKIEEWQSLRADSCIGIKFAAKDERLQKASSVARLALKLYNENKQIDYQKFIPVYMRKAEAERKLEAGLLSLKG